MTTPTINPSPAPANTPADGPSARIPVSHTHPFTAVTGLRFGTDGRVEPVYDSADVYANGVVIALYNAATPKTAFSPTAVPTVTISAAVQQNDGEDTSVGKAEADRFLAEGRISQKEYVEITAEVKPTTAGVAPTAALKGNTVTVEGTAFDFSTVLTPGGTTLGTMIKNVTFPRTIQQLSQGGPGMTPEKIVNNLANLAYNIYEPLKRQYPKAFITNSFRHGASIGGGQHGTGQAMDVQFRGVSSNDYFDIAVWMSKNLPYAQLLLEYLPNKTVWIHVSYEIPGLPYGGITIKPQNKLATLNGAAGGKFLPNLHADVVAKAVPNRVVAA
jgi:hypothetical protein